jgi:predicted nucleic acid-binding OB-fold protein
MEKKKTSPVSDRDEHAWDLDYLLGNEANKNKKSYFNCPQNDKVGAFSFYIYNIILYI